MEQASWPNHESNEEMETADDAVASREKLKSKPKKVA